MSESVNAEKPKTSFAKEYVFLVPLICSALALSFDVGYFWELDINFFTMFSLQEHLVFSLEVLPTAISVAVLLVGTLAALQIRGPIHRAMDKAYARYVSSRAPRWRLIITMVVLLSCVIFLGFQIWFMIQREQYLTVAVVAVAAGAILLGYVIPAHLRATAVTTYLFIVSMIGAQFIGGRIAVSYRSVDKFPHKVTTSRVVFDAKIVRSGERGILLYDRSNQLRLFPWSDVKEISSNLKMSKG